MRKRQRGWPKKTDGHEVVTAEAICSEPIRPHMSTEDDNEMRYDHNKIIAVC
ncbi:hypothetical protein DPMN_058874 [Dreissena polymorpha]|uniref:Uncharacterized protein n=1 Tax=Dreissena polymorpha TaxID=45954 RepID=A0A9D4C2U1_DREPO|nr:hypothetical protein DPMN_058874 [Dreissena polymorpha]